MSSTLDGLTARELLEQRVVLTPLQVAFVLDLTVSRGDRAGALNQRLVHALVERGELVPVDPSQPKPRQRFSSVAVARYLKDRSRPARAVAQVVSIAREAAAL